MLSLRGGVIIVVAGRGVAAPVDAGFVANIAKRRSDGGIRDNRGDQQMLCVGAVGTFWIGGVVGAMTV